MKSSYFFRVWVAVSDTNVKMEVGIFEGDGAILLELTGYFIYCRSPKITVTYLVTCL